MTDYEVRSAVRYFNDNKGSLRNDSGRYQSYVKAIASSDDPMGEAKRRVKLLSSQRERRLFQTVNRLVQQTSAEGTVSTQTLDALVEFIRSGFPNARLDAQRYRLVDDYETLIFAGKATLSNLISLAETLAQIQAYDPRTGKWSAFRHSSA